MKVFNIDFISLIALKFPFKRRYLSKIIKLKILTIERISLLKLSE